MEPGRTTAGWTVAREWSGDLGNGVWHRWASSAVRLRSDLTVLFLDIILVTAAYALMLVLRYDGRVPAAGWASFRIFVPLALLITVAVNVSIGLYGHVWRHASIYEAQRMVVAGGLSTTIVAFLTFFHRSAPLSTAISGGLVASMFMGLLRFHSRLAGYHRVRSTTGTGVIIIGGGDDCVGLVREMLRSPALGLVPVGVVDKNGSNNHKSLMGVPVLGSIDELADVVRSTGASLAIVAGTEAQRPFLPKVVAAAEIAGITLKILPDMGEAMRSGSAFQDIRDVKIEDLLGRQQVRTDLVAIRAMLRGKRVLITGAGGSIGSELVRQVAQCDPQALILLDHDETHLHDIASEFPVTATQLLLDIRNRDRVTNMFAVHRPHVVFHAAAHKHVPILEEYPCEAAATNVLGTTNVLDAAVRHGVERFVAISTDKAVYPSSIMGASKRISENLVVRRAPESGIFCAVRFGNVVGSRGSVVPTFMRQILAGGPVTVTDERMTRFFMSIPEAVQLVLQASALSTRGAGGQVYMLDMGEPVRIFDLAERMIRLAGYRPGEDIEIEITGIRPGEKLAEELVMVDEFEHPTEHPSIRRVSTSAPGAEVLSAGLDELYSCVRLGDDRRCARLLRALAGASGPDAGGDVLNGTKPDGTNPDGPELMSVQGAQ